MSQRLLLIYGLIIGALWVGGINLTYAQQPDVPLVGSAVCAHRDADGNRCNEAIQQCAPGCPDRGIFHGRDFFKHDQGFLGLSKTVVLGLIIGGALSIGLFLGLMYFFGGLISVAAVGLGIALMTGGITYYLLENEPTGEWYGRYTVTAPPECAGQNDGWKTLLSDESAGTITWSAGEITFTGKINGNTMDGIFIGPECAKNTDRQSITGTFFGGRIVK